MTREIHRNAFLKTQNYLVHLSQTETNQPNRQERERNKTARRKLEKNKITEADLVDKLRDKLGAVTCHPFSFRKERFHSPPLTYCKCHQEMAVSTHGGSSQRRKLPGPRSHLLPEQPTSYDRRTWRPSSPAGHPNSECL